MAVDMSGLIKIHAGPSTVCLYMTLKSRLTKSQIQDPERHSSRRSTQLQPSGRAVVDMVVLQLRFFHAWNSLGFVFKKAW